jgi:cytochrome c-type biogenesis protein CcmF
LWPIISEAINGQKSSVPEAFFNQVVIIPGLLLLFLTGAGPIISWKKITANNFQRMFLLPLVIGLVGGALTWGFLALIKEETSPLYSVLCVSVGTFVVVAIFAEFYRGAKLRAKRQKTSLLNGLNLLIQRNKRRYGGYIIHIGIVILYIGIMGSKGYFLLESKSMTLGESIEVGKYKLTMIDSFEKEYGNYLRSSVVFDVEKNGKRIGTMEPALHDYYKSKPDEEPTKEPAIRHFGMNDLYVALGNIPPNVKTGGVVNVQGYYNPLIGVVWIGVAVMVLGGIVAIAEKSERSGDS